LQTENSKSKKEITCYTVDRVFLSNISVTELISRIIRSHIINDVEGCSQSNEKNMENTLKYSDYIVKYE
jgi:hypothetical protein